MAFDKRLARKLADILQDHPETHNNNLVPAIIDAYLQGGAEYVNQMKEFLDNAGIEKKLFNDAIKKIITDFLSVALS